MEEIHDTNDSFDFSKLSLSNPVSMNGGTFFIRYLVNNTHLYIQPPKCSTKQGILKSGKKFYTDLIFTNEDENFIRWMENLESYSQKYIYNNRLQWFEDDMEIHDIENYFTSSLKVYKSGKYYTVRTNIHTVLGKPMLKIYDENEKDVEYETLTDKTSVMTILEICGIKCSSRSFQIEIELKQMMTVKPINLFDKILLKSGSNTLVSSAAETIDDSMNIQMKKEMILEEALSQPETPAVEEPNIDVSGSGAVEESTVSPILENTIENNLEKVDDGIEEVYFPLEEINESDTIHIKQRNEIYYNMYREAINKAKIAREFAISAYLEAKNIKNTYSLEDIEDSEEDEINLDFQNK